MDKFTIVITGSSRPELLKVTVESFKKFLYTEKEINWIMHEDIVYENESKKTIEYARNNGINIISSDHIGLSRGMMKILPKINTKYMLYLQDDWELERPVELDKFLWLMDNNDNVNNIILPKYQIPHALNKNPLKQVCIDNIDLVKLTAWYLNPGICRSNILKENWKYGDDKPEAGFIKNLRMRKIDGVFWLGKIHDYRYIRHLGDTWRMANWRKGKNNTPGGNILWEIGSLKYQAPWLSYKERLINTKLIMDKISKNDYNHYKKIIDKQPKEVKEHIMNGKEKLLL